MTYERVASLAVCLLRGGDHRPGRRARAILACERRRLSTRPTRHGCIRSRARRGDRARGSREARASVLRPAPGRFGGVIRYRSFPTLIRTCPPGGGELPRPATALCCGSGASYPVVLTTPRLRGTAFAVAGAFCGLLRITDLGIDAEGELLTHHGRRGSWPASGHVLTGAPNGRELAEHPLHVDELKARDRSLGVRGVEEAEAHRFASSLPKARCASRTPLIGACSRGRKVPCRSRTSPGFTPPALTETITWYVESPSLKSASPSMPRSRARISSRGADSAKAHFSKPSHRRRRARARRPCRPVAETTSGASSPTRSNLVANDLDRPASDVDAEPSTAEPFTSARHSFRNRRTGLERCHRDSTRG